MYTRLCLRATALMLALATTSGCGPAVKDDPEGHAALLETAAGVAVFELIITPDLWDQTSDLPLQEGVPTADPAKDLADRGLAQYNLSGTQLVSYLENLESRAYGGWWERGPFEVSPLHKRVYDEIAPVVAEIDGPRGPEDPAPRLVLDDTITDNA